MKNFLLNKYPKIQLKVKLLVKFLFIFYCIYLIYLLFFGFGRPPLFNDTKAEYNLRPFHTLKFFLNLDKNKHWEYFMINIAGNIFIFIPLGFWLSSKIKEFLYFSIFFIIIIFVIELLQYITQTGTADIDDILLNYIGGIVGFLLLNFYKKHIFEFNSTKK